VVSNFCHTEATQFSIENGQSIQSYLWNFGDGHTSTEAEPSHVYENTGKYSVTLEILKSDNSTENISKEIEIIEKPLKPVIVKSSD
jgi:PKD repeat protein